MRAPPDSPRPRPWPIFLSGTMEDFSLYLFQGVLFFLVIHLGGSSWDLGVVGGTASFSYVIGAIIGGRISDRLPRITLARLGCVAYAAVVLAIGQAGSIGAVRVLVVPVGLSMGLFWPPVQAHLGDIVSRHHLATALGRFNIFWSLGKSAGFFAAGLLVEALAPSYGRAGAISITITAAAIVGLAPLALLRGSDGAARPAGDGTSPPGSPPPPPRAVEPAAAVDPAVRKPDGTGIPFLHLAWIANFALFGSGQVLVTHHPKWIESIGLGELHSDVFLGTVFLSQTVAFLLWSAYTRWKYRLREFFIVQGLFVVAVAVVPFAGGHGPTLLLAPVIGLGVGLAYQASIYYSLAGGASRGRRTGLHEGILGSGNFLLPLLGGAVAERAADVRAPYLLAAAVGAVALVGEVVLAVRGRASSRSSEGA